MNSIYPSSEMRELAGHQLTWHRWLPEDAELKGALFLLHGQGDYGERYQEVAEFFLGEGIAFTICDLPGHGHSSGKRGHIPSWELVREISEMGMAQARALAPNKPVGFGGHSVGGLLALFLLGELKDKPDFSWISSPMLKPETRHPNWKHQLLRLLSHLLPSFSLSTGVTADMCRVDFSEEMKADHYHQFHNRISLSWGLTIIELAEVVRTQPERLPSPLAIILTQGQSDPICPHQHCEDLVYRLQRKDLKLILYPETRHEPFADRCRKELFADLKEWLAKTI